MHQTNYNNQASDTSYYFLLGAPDPEMNEIEKVITQLGIPFQYATDTTGKRSNSRSAYSASYPLGMTAMSEACQLVTVECGIPTNQLSLPVQIDHHNEGDVGFAKLPHDYLAGSSLGQTLSLLGQAPSLEQKIICAADHCLASAYAGKCPDVAHDDVLYHRLSSKADFMGKTLDKMFADMAKAKEELLAREWDNISYFISESLPPLATEASAALNLPIIYRNQDQTKEMMKGGSFAQIEAFLSYHRDQGREVYGNPYRGYAGAYLHQS